MDGELRGEALDVAPRNTEEPMNTAEQSAREARRGLWDGDFDNPWAFREDGGKDDLIAIAWRWVMDNWRWVFEQIF